MYSIACLSHQLLQIKRRFTAGGTHRVDDSDRDIIKTLCAAGADVVNAGHRMLPKVQIDADDVVHVNKVPPLFAVL